MRVDIKQKEKTVFIFGMWNDFFAIFPRKIGEQWVFFETIERKITHHKSTAYTPPYNTYEYRIKLG